MQTKAPDYQFRRRFVAAIFFTIAGGLIVLTDRIWDYQRSLQKPFWLTSDTEGLHTAILVADSHWEFGFIGWFVGVIALALTLPGIWLWSDRVREYLRRLW